MKKLTFLSAGLAGALAVLGLGCSHNTAGPAEPNTRTGAAATTRTGIDSTGNAAPGTVSGSPAMPAANPALPPGQSPEPPLGGGAGAGSGQQPQPGTTNSPATPNGTAPSGGGSTP